MVDIIIGFVLWLQKLVIATSLEIVFVTPTYLAALRSQNRTKRPLLFPDAMDVIIMLIQCLILMQKIPLMSAVTHSGTDSLH